MESSHECPSSRLTLLPWLFEQALAEDYGKAASAALSAETREAVEVGAGGVLFWATCVCFGPSLLQSGLALVCVFMCGRRCFFFLKKIYTA